MKFFKRLFTHNLNYGQLFLQFVCNAKGYVKIALDRALNFMRLRRVQATKEKNYISDQNKKNECSPKLSNQDLEKRKELSKKSIDSTSHLILFGFLPLTHFRSQEKLSDSVRSHYSSSFWYNPKSF